MKQSIGDARVRRSRSRSLSDRVSYRLKRALFALDRALDRFSVSLPGKGSARLGLAPINYYSSLVSRRWLRKNEALWRRPSELRGIDWDVDAQFTWLERTVQTHLAEVDTASLVSGVEKRGIRFSYGPIEAEVLHCFMRSVAPSRVLEVGAGASSAIMSDASLLNASEGGSSSTITCVDPFLSADLAGLPGVEHRSVEAQLLPIDAFEELDSGDLLFIDSSHTVKTGSELHRIYLEGIPSLAPGVYIHVHDVFLPYLHRPEILTDFWDFQETALLAALLIGNQGIEVLCSLSALHDAAPERLAQILPDFVPGRLQGGVTDEIGVGNFPSSIWLRTRGAE